MSAVSFLLKRLAELFVAMRKAVEGRLIGPRRTDLQDKKRLLAEMALTDADIAVVEVRLKGETVRMEYRMFADERKDKLIPLDYAWLSYAARRVRVVELRRSDVVDRINDLGERLLRKRQ